MRVAVVGAGLAGLTAAWLLSRQHSVALFERHAQPGFTAANVALSSAVWTLGGPDAEPLRVDVPLRVFYPGYYPHLTALYRALAVPTEAVSYASSFHGPALAGAAGPGLYFRYRNLRWGQRSYGYLAPQDFLLLGAPARRIVGALLRFNREAVAALRRGELAGLSIGEFASSQSYPAEFVDGFLLPAISTVCTCSFEHARCFPAEVIVDYLARGVGSQSVHRALQGADDVQRRLLKGISQLRCGARTALVSRMPAGGQGGVQLQLEDGSTQHFDHVVLATQANQVRRLLADASADEAAMLAGFQYQPVQVVTHSDSALMPARRRDWSPVNLWVSRERGLAESTIWVNAVQPALRAAAPVFQTVHPLRSVRDDAVLGRAQFERPVVDAHSQQALLKLQQLQAEPERRVWFCGAYAQAGIPLLESAVCSAFEVAARLGVVLPQQGAPLTLPKPQPAPAAGLVATNKA